ncbi:class I SAM-dependent methyltransferase [Sphingomonas piscis]|uniref:Class I SAM-dependent methyltransferase n=2 Tax=Sphingomonas piscis TaxID=2714943 RepID=A0A6G7YTM8_9SPHN|nr:class I SAM-dependent methyltransferase [Sphingomonas piscis]
MSHAMVTCRVCDLAYVDRPPSAEELAESYHSADYDSAREAEDAADAYAEAIEPVLKKLKSRGSALEIGTGTAAFLERLKHAGFKELVGIEPSTSAIAAAPEHRKAWIREGVFEGNDFPPDSFDLICCFMTLEHVHDPGSLVAAAHRLLRPGGVFVGVTHDRRGVLNRMLGKRSPIVDVEHMQLFSAQSSRELLERNGYCDVAAKSFWNRYRLSYWLRLVPMGRSIKDPLTAAIRVTPLDAFRIPMNVGNTISWGFKR